LNKRNRKVQKTENYFTKRNEEAIVAYVLEQDRRKKEKIFRELILPVFHELIEKIVFTYRFVNLPDIDGLKSECESYLVTVLEKYKQEKGKAFSYFTVVSRNWFYCQAKKLSTPQMVSCDDVPNDIDETYIVETEYVEDRQKNEFFLELFSKIDEWEKHEDFTSETDQIVISAVRDLFINSEKLEMFSRKGIYLYLREITGLPTKKIVFVLNKMRKRYFRFKKEWQR